MRSDRKRVPGNERWAFRNRTIEAKSSRRNEQQAKEALARWEIFVTP
jgi:hypothetical protein